MVATDFPIGIVITVVVGVLIAAALFRVGRKKAPEFECDVCGRKQQGLAAKEWRFCPYCGSPHKLPPRIAGIQL